MQNHGHTAPDPCPECGAPTVDGMDCQAQLGLILAWEWDDPALLAVHFLTVAAYNLQHPAQFTDDALAALRMAFADYLDGKTTIAGIRARMGRLLEGSNRVLRPESARRPVLRRWRMTIADVVGSGQAEGAAQRVQAWAASIRGDLA